MNKKTSLAAGVVGVVVLAAAGRAGCLPEGEGYVKVAFQRTSGVGDFNYYAPVNLDSKTLSAEEVKQLRKLIDDAGFFDLTSTPPLPPEVPDVPAGYDLTVDMDGRTHHIWIVDGAVGKSLQPLIDYLTRRARPWLEEVPLMDRRQFDPVNDWLRDSVEIRQDPVLPRAEEKRPAIHVDFTMGGGVLISRWTAKIDSAVLSAEDTQKLARLIADARFFEQPEQFPPSEPADAYGYTLTVEMNGKKHTVHVDEAKVPAEMKPLVEWLFVRAEEEGPIGCVVPLAM